MTMVHAFNPAEALLLDEWPPEDAGPIGSVAILGVDDVAMAEVVAERVEQVTLYPRHIEAYELARRVAIDRFAVSDAVVPPADGALDAALLAMPQGRYVNRMILAAVRAALREGGELWVAGPTSGGAKPTIADATSLLGEGEVVAFKHRQRLARMIKRDGVALPEWSTEPGVAPGSFGGFEIDLDGVRTAIKTRPGVFAWNGLDETARLLMEHIDVPEGGVVANPCCGAGTIGLYAAMSGAGRVTMSDHDLLAVASARAGVEANGLSERVEIAACGCERVGPSGACDLLVAFPPMDERREATEGGRPMPRAVERIVAAAPEALKPDGRLVVAIPAYASLDKPLKRAGLAGRVLAESRRATLIEAHRA
ncbi:MAG: methyltransferase [Planctomycetota bacterium]